MKKLTSIFYIVIISFSTIMFTSCEKLEEILVHEKTPTKTLMEGVWTVKEAIDLTTETDITDRVNFPITAFQLSSDGTIISTSSPLMMYIVYGDNQYTKIASDIDQVFNYTSLDFNGGEFFIEGGQANRFTLEMKLEGLPGQKTLTSLLEKLGIGNSYLDVVVYHKFMDVKVSIDEKTPKIMVWEIDDATWAVYNTKDKQGNYVLWEGWEANRFSNVKITLEKQVRDIPELITSLTENTEK